MEHVRFCYNNLLLVAVLVALSVHMLGLQLEYKLGISVGSSTIWSSTEKRAVVVDVVAKDLDDASSLDSAVTMANHIALRLNKSESS